MPPPFCPNTQLPNWQDVFFVFCLFFIAEKLHLSLSRQQDPGNRVFLHPASTILTPISVTTIQILDHPLCCLLCARRSNRGKHVCNITNNSWCDSHNIALNASNNSMCMLCICTVHSIMIKAWTQRSGHSVGEDVVVTHRQSS